MHLRDALWAAPSLAMAVLLSSFLGLVASSVVHTGGSLSFLRAVWSDSLPADFVFVLGSVLAMTLTWIVAEEHPWASVLIGAMSHYAVYLASFLLLSETWRRAALGNDAAITVLLWGLPGLVFAAGAPAIGRRWRGRSKRTTALAAALPANLPR